MAKREIPEINAGSMADIAFLLLIFFLVTTTMDKDTAYIRQIPKLIELEDQPPIEVEPRNICEIAANNKNDLLFRGENMTDPDEISDKIIEFYTINRDLGKDKTNINLKNPSYKGYNFPFYSYTTKNDLEMNIRLAEVAIEEAEADPNMPKDMMDFKYRVLDDWLKKQIAMDLFTKTGKNILPEIHLQAHIRIVVMQQTEYELFAKIQSEVEEALYELRDLAALDLFGESYGKIKSRHAMNKLSDDMKDGPKLKLLSVLYPDRIIEVKPN